VRVTVALGVILVCVQVVLGLLNVTLRLPTDLREAHAVNAAFVFLAFFIATVLAALDAFAHGAPRRLGATGGHQ
jgi:heme A synthase